MPYTCVLGEGKMGKYLNKGTRICKGVQVGSQVNSARCGRCPSPSSVTKGHPTLCPNGLFAIPVHFEMLFIRKVT